MNSRFFIRSPRRRDGPHFWLAFARPLRKSSAFMTGTISTAAVSALPLIVLQKSPSRLCEIEICNNRIGAPVLLNRCCSFVPDLESMFRDQMPKILLQHTPPQSRHRQFATTCLLRAKSGCEQSQQGCLFFDHLVGQLLKMQRHLETKRLGAFQIDDQLELGG